MHEQDMYSIALEKLYGGAINVFTGGL